MERFLFMDAWEAPSLVLRSSSELQVVGYRLNPALGEEGGLEAEIRMCNSVHCH